MTREPILSGAETPENPISNFLEIGASSRAWIPINDYPSEKQEQVCNKESYWSYGL